MPTEPKPTTADEAYADVLELLRLRRDLKNSGTHGVHQRVAVVSELDLIIEQVVERRRRAAGASSDE